MIKSQIRKRIILSLLFVTPAGFLFKFYAGPARWWFNNYGAGLWYEIFWILVIFFFFPYKSATGKIPLWVFVITSILEVLQLWHPVILEKIRATFLGGALIGDTFCWGDFPHYVFGCVIGWLWIQWIMRRELP